MSRLHSSNCFHCLLSNIYYRTEGIYSYKELWHTFQEQCIISAIEIKYICSLPLPYVWISFQKSRNDAQKGNCLCSSIVSPASPPSPSVVSLLSPSKCRLYLLVQFFVFVPQRSTMTIEGYIIL